MSEVSPDMSEAMFKVLISDLNGLTFTVRSPLTPVRSHPDQGVTSDAHIYAICFLRDEPEFFKRISSCTYTLVLSIYTRKYQFEDKLTELPHKTCLKCPKSPQLTVFIG